MANNKAKVEVAVEGAAEAERKLKKLSDSFKSFGGEMAGALTSAIRGLGSLSMELTRVEPGQLAQKFRDFRGTVTEFSVAAGRSVAEVKASFASLSKSTLLPDDQVASFTATLSKATYDFKDSGKALVALRNEGVATGRALEEMAPIAETLHNVFGESFDEMPETLGDIRAAAEELGTSGGPAALQDQIAALGGMLSEVSVKGTADAKGLVAVLASLGKGLKPEQQKKVQQELVSTFVSGGEQLRRNLGIKTEDFYDENGQIKLNAANVKKLRDFNLKQAGGNRKEAFRRSALRHGGMYAAALYSSSLDSDLESAGSAVRSATPEQAVSAFKGSEHGTDLSKQIERDRRAREEVGGLTNSAQQKMADVAPSDPIVRAIVTGFAGVVASNLLGKGISTALEAGFKSIAPMFASSATTAAAAGEGTAVVGATGAGIASVVSKAVPVVALATIATMDTDNPNAGKNIDSMKKGRHEVQHKHLWGLFSTSTWEDDVPPGQRASSVSKQDPKYQKTTQQEVKVTVGFAADTPLSVVSVEKGNAGRQ